MPQSHTPRSVLWAAPVVTGYFSAAYYFGGAQRTATPSFETAKSVMTIQQWGLLFAIGAMCMTISLLVHNQLLCSVAYFVAGCVYTWWSACFAIQAITSKEASLNAWVMHGAFAVICFGISQRCWVNRRNSVHHYLTRREQAALSATRHKELR